MVGSQHEEKIRVLDFESFVAEKSYKGVNVLDGELRNEIDQFLLLNVVFQRSMLSRSEIRLLVKNSSETFVEMQIFILIEAEISDFCAFFFLRRFDEFLFEFIGT